KPVFDRYLTAASTPDASVTSVTPQENPANPRDTRPQPPTDTPGGPTGTRPDAVTDCAPPVGGAGRHHPTRDSTGNPSGVTDVTDRGGAARGTPEDPDGRAEREAVQAEQEPGPIPDFPPSEPGEAGL